MKLRAGDTSNPHSIASQMRKARLRRFFELINPQETHGRIYILDVGGTAAFWRSNWNEHCNNLVITLLNLEHTNVTGDLPIRSEVGDARSMPQYHDGQFDFCFSNSVIEHVGSLYDQKRMAEEIRRVARGYFVQTPYRFFPIEPHYQFPGWAQLPYWVRTFLHQRMDLGWVQAERDYLDARIRVEDCRLLSIREMRLLFPEGNIEFERMGPIIKSLIATRRPEPRRASEPNSEAFRRFESIRA